MVYNWQGCFVSDEKTSYWQSLHSRVADDLAAVCYPTKPAVYNRLVNGIFARAIEGALGQLRPGKVLEIGCGRGRWLRLLSQQGWKTFGIDIARVARPQVMASASAVPFRAGTFDLVLAITVLQHLEEKEEALDEVRRLLAPSGRLLLLELLDRKGMQWQQHVMPRTDVWWQDILREKGFCIEREEPVEYMPLVQWIEKRRFGRGTRRTSERLGEMPSSGARRLLKHMAWTAIALASYPLEPLAPRLGIYATHCLFLCRKNGSESAK